MSWFLEEIEKLQRQIEILRPQAVSELKAKLGEARSRVAEIEREISKLTGDAAPARAVRRTEVPIGITTEHRQVHQERKDHAPAFGEICAGVRGSIGQNTDVTDIKWEESYSKLLAFRQEFGHLRIPVQNPDFRRLNEWLREQRTRHTSLEPDQIRKLLALGVGFGATDTMWYQQFFALCDYVKAHGEFPKGRTSLSRWIESQRRRKKNGTLLPNRSRLLDSLGIDWSPYANRDVFPARLAELKAFKAQHGHCNVP